MADGMTHPHSMHTLILVHPNTTWTNPRRPSTYYHCNIPRPHSRETRLSVLSPPLHKDPSAPQLSSHFMHSANTHASQHARRLSVRIAIPVSLPANLVAWEYQSAFTTHHFRQLPRISCRLNGKGDLHPVQWRSPGSRRDRAPVQRWTLSPSQQTVCRLSVTSSFQRGEGTYFRCGIRSGIRDTCSSHDSAPRDDLIVRE